MVGGFCGRFTVTDDWFRNPHQFFAQLPKPEGTATEGNLRNGKECGIEGFKNNAVLKNVDTNSTSIVTTPS